MKSRYFADHLKKYANWNGLVDSDPRKRLLMATHMLRVVDVLECIDVPGLDQILTGPCAPQGELFVLWLYNMVSVDVHMRFSYELQIVSFTSVDFTVTPMSTKYGGIKPRPFVGTLPRATLDEFAKEKTFDGN